MVEELLKYSLERINSLKHFYLLEKKSINSKVTKGIKKNRFGFSVDTYFRFLSCEDSEILENVQFQRLEKCVLKDIEIVSNRPEGDRYHVQFKFKNKDKLEKAGKETNIKNATTAYYQFVDMPIIHEHNTLIMLITRFEEFFANLLRFLYEKYPQLYLDNQKVSFSQIKDMGIDEVRQQILFQEVDSAMREKYDQWFTILKKHGMKFEVCEDELTDLNEIYARRNIVVHNSGKVNAIYKSLVPNSNAEIGELLRTSEKYLNESFNTIKTLIFIVLIESVKISDRDKGAELYSIFEMAYEELSQENYKMCKKVFTLISDSKYATADIKLMARINSWIAKGELDGYDSIKEEVTNFDVSTLQDIFVLAKYALLLDSDKTLQFADYLYEKEPFIGQYIVEWPLFKRFRETEQYISFTQSHTELQNIASIEVDSCENTACHSE